MKIQIEIGSFRLTVQRGLGWRWRRGRVKAFSPDPLYRVWAEASFGLVRFERDRLVPYLRTVSR